jgi:hypothetical protein
VLTDDNGALFARLEIVRKEQDTVSKNILPDIEEDFVAFPERLIIDEPRPWVGRHIGEWTLTDLHQR